VADYGRAIERDPGNVRHYGQRAWTYTLLEQIDLAIADYTTAIELAPEVAEYWRERGFRYFDRQDYEAAREGFDRAIELDPQECPAYFGRGHYWLQRGEYATAVDEFSKALEICPDYGDIYISRGWIYLEHLDRADLALDDLNRAVELDPKGPHPRFQRALAHDRLDHVAEARRDYEAFLRLSEGDASWADGRAQAERWLAEHPQ
jgi:Tfp pilus assembly protein PilF